MLINGTHIEDACKFLLQKNLSFEIKNKTIKKGKIILFFQRNFHIVFIIESNNKRDKIEIPIPFKIEQHKSDNLTYFDYRVSTFSKMFPESEPFLTLFTQKVAKSKFYDSILVISNE